MKSKLSLVMVAALSMVGMGCCQEQNQEPWKDLFDGKTLDGWNKKNGEAKYTVENGEIVGTATMNTPNTFLCTDETYADFILEVDFKADGDLNSGVQFRSHSYPEFNKGRVHGYQCELDPTDRKWTGGIYDEARRGWLYPVDSNIEAQNAYKHLEWNKIRIEAIGDTIKTFINNIPVAHLVDDMTDSGFIGLQVHDVGKNEKLDGVKLHWKNIRIITENPRKYATQTTLPAVSKINELTHTEKAQGWKLLFDGKSSDGWRGAKLNDFPKGGWSIEDGVLTIHESGGGEAADAGDIVTVDKYKDFMLHLDFKISPGANSGIKYFVDTQLNKGEGSSIGLEYQILDDELHPDAKLGSHDGSRTLGSVYDLIKAENKFPKPIGEWNNAMIISKDKHVEHWLNGRKMLQYERGSDDFRKLVSESKYKVWKDFGEFETGHILLQDHGNTVSFRNIKIKEL